MCVCARACSCVTVFLAFLRRNCAEETLPVRSCRPCSRSCCCYPGGHFTCRGWAGRVHLHCTHIYIYIYMYCIYTYMWNPDVKQNRPFPDMKKNMLPGYEKEHALLAMKKSMPFRMYFGPAVR